MAKETAIGLELSGEDLRWSVIRRAKDRPGAADSGSVALTPPVEGDDGAVSPGDQLKAACTHLKGAVSLVLPSHKVLLRAVSLPLVEANELGSMVELQVDKFSPFPVETLVISHEILSRGDSEMRVLVAAVQRAVVNDLSARFEGTGVSFKRLDVAALIWWRLLADAGELPDEGRRLVVILSRSEPEIMAIDNGVPVMFRTLAGGASGPSADELVHEIEHTLMTWELEHGTQALMDIGIWSCGGVGEALETRLRDAGFPVRAGSLDALPPVTEGAARRLFDAGAMNLVPVDWRAAGSARLIRRRLLRVAASLVLLWLLLAGGAYGALKYQEIILSRLRAQEEALSRQALEVRDLRRRVVMVNRYLNKDDSALEYLREISALLPPGIDLSSFSYHEGEGVKLSGEAQAVNQVYDFRNQVDGSELFNEAALVGPRLNTQTGRQLFDLEIKLREDQR